MIYCQKCGAQNVDGVRFCEKCGAPVDANSAMPSNSGAQAPIQQNKVCNECGQELPPSATVCTLCGAPVAAAQTFTAPPPAPPQPQAYVQPQQQQNYAPQQPSYGQQPPPQQYGQQPPPIGQQLNQVGQQLNQVGHQVAGQIGTHASAQYKQFSKNPNKNKIIAGVAAAIVVIIIIIIATSGGGNNNFVGTWVGDGMYEYTTITFRRNGTVRIESPWTDDTLKWGTERGNILWMEYENGYKLRVNYEFKGRDLYLDGDRLTKRR